VWGPEELAAEPAWIGLNGSPTRVVKIVTPQAARHGKTLVAKDAAAIEQAADSLIAFLKEKRVILP
jgi:electron transfer flavoprotein beta subunit